MIDDPYHKERQMLDAPQPDRKMPRWFWIMLGAAALLVAGMSLARAAEPHVITVTFAGKDYDHVQRTTLVLGNPPAIYESRETCNVAITRVRVHLSGARLQCNPQRN